MARHRMAVLCGLCLALSGCRSVVTAQDVQIAGSYTVVGENPDQTLYRGRAEVTQEGAITHLQYFNSQDELMSIGIGLREGAVLSVIFQTNTGAVGVATYRLEPDRWVGHWVIAGTVSVLTETLTRTNPKLHGAERGPSSVL